jgi:hypothetical protein
MLTTTASDERAMKLYLSIMEEVKLRASSINTAINLPNGLPVELIREYCFLQLRMLCELVALGCLVAHGDITNTSAFRRAYRADQILDDLERLHPDFYPYPVLPEITPPSAGNPGSVHLNDVTFDFLKKKDLIRLYGKCGDVLHKGNFERLISPRKPLPSNYSYQDIQEPGQKLINLLNNHRISRVGREFHLIVLLQAASYGGGVHIAIAKSPPQSESQKRAPQNHGKPYPV